MPKRRSDECNRSELKLATTSKEEAQARNEHFKREGIAAHHEYEPRTGAYSLVFRTSRGEREALKALGQVNFDSYG